VKGELEMPKKERSRLLTEGVERAPHRAMLRAIGFTDEDLNKPFGRHRQHMG
jgi:dihydroxyacid dehydratase (EC 4.2.1.9)